jgi:predicted enzyme related to lactoylglutathione lyase
MNLNFNSILISSENPEVLRLFYEKILDKEPDMDQGEYFGFLVGNNFLSFGPHDKIRGKSKNPERIIINFETSEVKEEFERIKKLGVEVIAEPYEMGDEGGFWIATFADPDGNYFQLITPWDEGKN